MSLRATRPQIRAFFDMPLVIGLPSGQLVHDAGEVPFASSTKASAWPLPSPPFLMIRGKRPRLHRAYASENGRP
jgi:hypothetical protein